MNTEDDSPHVAKGESLYRKSHAKGVEHGQRMTIAGVLGFVVTFALFLAVPFVVMISRVTNERQDYAEIGLAPPPPPPPEEKEPPQEKERRNEFLELSKPQPRIKLKQLKLSLDPGPHVADLSADFSFNLSANDAEMVFEWGEIDKDPRVTSQMRPIYPFSLSKNGIEGEVSLEFIVSPDGSVRSIEVIKGDGVEFIKEAIAAVKRWKFKPGIKDGEAVSVRMRITIPFILSKNRR